MKRKEVKINKKKPIIPNSWAENTKLHLFVIFLFAIVLYANTLTNDYTQDDAIVITDNMFVKKGFSGIPGILSKDTFYGFFKKEGKDKLVSGGRYRPLSLVFFAIEWQLFGRNPLVSHLLNIILYGLLGIVLYKFLSLLFLESKQDSIKYLVPFFATLIFIGHPIHTEAVANIKGRDEILVLLFSLLSVFYSMKYVQTRGLKNQIIVFVLFLFALFSKENAITFLAIVPLVYYFFFNSYKKSYIKILFPFISAAIVFLAVRTVILGFDFGSQSMELMNNPFLKIDGNKFVPFSFSEKFATILFTLGKYIQLLVFPHPLTNDYYPRQIAVMSFGNWQVLFSLLLYVGMIYFTLRYYKKNKIIVFSILFYIITLSIVSNIIFPVGTNMSERFLFMPSVGFSIIIGYLLYVLFDKNRGLALGLISIILLMFSFKTISRNTVWKNDFTLFTTDVKVSNNSAKALNAAGGSLVDASYKENNKSKKRKMLMQAKEYLNKALTIHPNYKNALLILGNANYFLEDYEASIDAFEKALTLAPNYEEAIKNLGIAYRDAGKYYGEKKNNLPKSLSFLKKAFEMNPEEYETVRLYGVANAMSGNNSRAIELFTKAVELQPDNAGAYLNLGNAYFNIGDSEKGRKYHDKARSLDPNVFKNNN